MKVKLKYFLIFGSFLVVFSCEKDLVIDDSLIGNWEILTPDNDTIAFQNELSFIRRYNDKIDYSFKYSTNKDSVTIQYNGPNMILVQPSTHFYELKNNELSIDFSNGCYGFVKEKYILIRLE